MSFFPHRYSAIVLCACLAATVACQTAQKQTFLPPGKAQAPALIASATPEPTQQKPVKSAATDTQTKAAAQALAVDPVGDLIKQVEKQYQTGQDDYHRSEEHTSELQS